MQVASWWDYGYQTTAMANRCALPFHPASDTHPYHSYAANCCRCIHHAYSFTMACSRGGCIVWFMSQKSGYFNSQKMHPRITCHTRGSLPRPAVLGLLVAYGSCLLFFLKDLHKPAPRKMGASLIYSSYSA